MNYLEYIKYVALIAALVTSLWLVHDKIYSSGYKDATEHYTDVIAKYQEAQNNKITGIEKNLTDISTSSSALNRSVSVGITDIKKNLLLSKTPIVKAEDCTLSQEFLDSRNKVIDKANQR
jgi:hypothetical protein